MSSVTLTFPDGVVRSYNVGITGAEIAANISKSLYKKAVAISLNNILVDLNDPIINSSTIKIITRTDKEALELIRHDCAHVLAQAVQELFPDTQVAIGPVIKNGFYYDFARQTPFSLDDLKLIEEHMVKIIELNEPFTKEIWSLDRAKSHFKSMGEIYKIKLLEAIPKGDDIKIYRQGKWLDLCRGPHMPSTGRIGTAFKLMSVAGAYWRGDARNPMLQRIYGTAWSNDKDLKAYLKQLKEAERRDHRKLGREMDLFHFQEEGPGVVFWHPKGWELFQRLTSYIRRRQNKAGYSEINTPQILDRSLWETSGHWEWYHENMFTTITEDERQFAVKPMNCPGHVQIFKHGLRSYRELPYRISEFGYVHRYEPSGALHGLMRVRGFTQDDAHVFCKEDQLENECLAINDLILSIYRDFGFDKFLIKLSTRPQKRVGSDEEWDRAESVMAQVLKSIQLEAGKNIVTSINPGEGAFYGPKFEYILRDAIGREWQCGTNQVDFNLPERFDIFYIGADGKKRRPIMLHRAILGSMERFLGVLIESYAGNFPLWLSPLQVVVCTVVSEVDEYADEVMEACIKAGLTAETDKRNEKITYKVREHSLAKVPVLLVVGRHEADEAKVSIRRLGSKNQSVVSLKDALASLVKEATPPDLNLTALR
ncbi:MAG: Threonine--tRNA ligase [Hyphomicrobiaceae bacterium hypho_1]